MEDIYLSCAVIPLWKILVANLRLNVEVYAGENNLVPSSFILTLKDSIHNSKDLQIRKCCPTTFKFLRLKKVDPLPPIQTLAASFYPTWILFSELKKTQARRAILCLEKVSFVTPIVWKWDWAFFTELQFDSRLDRHEMFLLFVFDQKHWQGIV